MQKDVWIDARSLSRPYVTGWERYVQNLAIGMKNHQNIYFDFLASGSKFDLLVSDFVSPKKSKEFKVSHFPTYPPIFKSKAIHQLITIHDLTWWKFPNYSSLLGKTYYKFFMGKALLQSSAIIVPSNSIKNDLLNWFNFDENKLHIIEHGNSLPEGKLKKFDKPYFLSFGTIEPRKNLDFYAKAILKSGLNKDFDFIHVGRKGWGTLPDVFKTYSANDHELADLIKNSQCVVIPSKYEGFGLPVLESHYQDKSVIISDDPALCELKLDSDSVFNLNSLDSLVDVLINCSTKTNVLTKDEVNKVKKYNWENSVKKHLDLYRKFYE